MMTGIISAIEAHKLSDTHGIVNIDTVESILQYIENKICDQANKGGMEISYTFDPDVNNKTREVIYRKLRGLKYILINSISMDRINISWRQQL